MNKRISSLFLLTAMSAAQTPPQEPATFHAATRLVEVDVIAGSKGAPATGLSKEDFTLLENGKPPKISFFSVRSSRKNPTPGTVPLPAGAVSNTPPDTQAFAIQRIKTFVQTSRNRDRFA
jgi:hypothetical protein